MNARAGAEQCVETSFHHAVKRIHRKTTVLKSPCGSSVCASDAPDVAVTTHHIILVSPEHLPCCSVFQSNAMVRLVLRYGCSGRVLIYCTDIGLSPGCASVT